MRVRNVLIWMFAAVVVAVGVSAQDGPPRLRVPTAEEYLEAVIRLNLNAELEGRLPLAEVALRYEETLHMVNYDLLSTAFNALFDSGLPPRQDLWENARVIAWMRENQISLAQHEKLHFDDFDIRITPVDFSGEGNPEFILEIVRGYCANESDCPRYDYLLHEYGALLVIDQIEPGNYAVIPHPLPWLSSSSSYHYASMQGGDMWPLEIRDLTGDGVPEWQVAVTHGSSIETTAQLYVLGWRNGALVDLASSPILRPVGFTGGSPDLRDWSGFEFNLIDEREPEPTPTATTSVKMTATPIADYQSFATWDVFWDLQWGEYEAVTKGVEQVMADQDFIASMSDYQDMKLHYVYALSLEWLGREDEAAAQYAAIAADESYPEWAALAALHLEPAEGQ